MINKLINNDDSDFTLDVDKGEIVNFLLILEIFVSNLGKIGADFWPQI